MTFFAEFIRACCIDVTFSALMNGPLVWSNLRRHRKDLSVEDKDTEANWSTLTEWSRDKDLKIVPEELERKISAMFPEDIVVHVAVQPPAEINEPDKTVQKSAATFLAP